MFGGSGYVAPEARVLTSITESPNPGAADYSDTNKFVQIVQTHDYEIRDLASGQQQLQQGVNDATQNPVQQIQQFIAEFVVLLGGGQLAEGALDFGDLQYILPTLGALFGIGDGPFPLDLFQAAERFFFGAVVPQKQFTDLINTMIGAWMGVFGIDPKFIKDTKALITAIGQLFGEVGNLLPTMNTFFGALGMGGSGAPGGVLGPLGAVLGPIIKLFSGINLAEFGNAIEFITAAIDPWIVKLTALIDFINEVLAVLAFPGDVVNDPLPQLIVPFKNLVRMLGNVQLGLESFNPVAAAQSWLGQLLLPISGFSTVQPNLQVNAGFDDSNDLGDAADGRNWTREDLDPPVTDGDWVWDLLGRTADGSATVHANGVDHGLLGNVVYVDEGHTFDFDAYVSWSGLTAATGALALHIQTDDGTNVPIASVTSPGATGDWTHLSGSYTVPSGVTSIRLRLFVGSGATAGQVWFDDTNIRRTNLIHQGLIQDLEDDLAQLFGFFQDLLTAAGAGDVVALGGDVATALSDAGSALSKIGDMLTAAVVATPTALGDLIATAATEAGQAGTDIQSIINNSEAADAAAVGTALLGAVTDADSALSQLGSLITNSTEADAAALGTALHTAIGDAASAVAQLSAIIAEAGVADADAVGAALAGAASDAASAIGQLSIIVTGAGAADAAALGDALAPILSAWSSLLNNLFGGTSVASQILVSAVPTGIPRANISGLTGYLANLTSSGVLSLSGLASGALPSGVTAGISQITSLSGYLTNLSSSGVLSGISAVSGLGGYLTNLSSSGVLALSGLASGALPAGVTAAISNVTGLAGYLTNLTSGGVLSLAGLAPGALPAGITLAGTQLTGAMNTGLTVAGQYIGDIQSNLATALNSLFPVATAGDPYWGNVVALLHCDGTNGSTTFTDSSLLAANWTANNGAVISTAQSKFGGASASFPNGNSYINAAGAPANYAFGTGDFTIEMWAYATSYSGYSTLIDFKPTSGANGPYIELTVHNGFLYLFVNHTIPISATAPSTGAWHHIALCRASGTTKMFIDGVAVGGTYSGDTSNYSVGSGPFIGGDWSHSAYWNGYVDDVRITKGIARYTSNFTPPAAAFLSTGVTYGGIGSALNTGLTISGNSISTLFNSSGVIASKIAGALNPAVTFLVGGSNVALSTLLQNLNTTGQFAASALTGTIAAGVTGAISNISGLSGYLTNLSSGGVLALAGLASGTLPAGVTAGISQITSLSGYLANLSSGGVLALAGLASGALPAGVTLASSQLTSLATGIGSWLAAGGALPSATSLAATQLSGLATGIQAWLGAGGALPSATVLAVNQLSGLGSGIATWLAGAGALPGTVTVGAAQIAAGALNTAITVAGTAIGDVQSNASNAIAQINDVVDNAFGAAAAAETVLGVAMSDFVSGLWGAWTSETGQASASQAIDAATALAASVGTATEHLAIIGNGAEEQVDIDFSTFSNGSLPSIFTILTGSGWSVSSGLLNFSGSFLSIIYYNGATFLSDFQKVSATFPSFSGGVGPGLVGRLSSAGTDDIAAEYVATSGYWKLSCDNFAVSLNDTFSNSAEYTLICGDPVSNDPYQYQLLKDGSPLTITGNITGPYSSQIGQNYLEDSSHLSSVGGGFRQAGIKGTDASFTVSNFKFQDTAPSEPSTFVATSEATSSSTYTDLTTKSDEVVVAIGDSGKVAVSLDAYSSSANGFVSVEISGVNTIAASDNNAAAGVNAISAHLVFTKLNPDPKAVFKMKYRSSSGSVSFSRRRCTAIAL